MATATANIQAEISKSQERVEALETELAAAENRLAEVEMARRLAEDAQQHLAEVSGADALAEVPDHAVSEGRAEIARIEAEIRRERTVMDKLQELRAAKAAARAGESVRRMEPIFDARDKIAADLLKATEALVALGDDLEESDQECILAHRLAAQACSAAGLPKPEYRRFYFGTLHAVHERFKGKRATVELINSLNRGA